MLCGMWDLPGPGLKPVSPALAGRFLTTVPSGKPLAYVFKFFDIANTFIGVMNIKMRNVLTDGWYNT